MKLVYRILGTSEKEVEKKRNNNNELRAKKFGYKIVNMDQYNYVRKYEFNNEFMLYMFNLLFYMSFAFFVGLVLGFKLGFYGV